MFRPPALAIPSPRVSAPARPPSGHVYRVEGKRGAVWYAKCRLPDARQVKRKIGPAWSERGRPPRATSRSASPRTGCASCSTRPAAGFARRPAGRVAGQLAARADRLIASR